MAYPLTHLCVAYKINKDPRFLLGALAPDAIHYRRAFINAAMSGIGAAKKITHICPVSNEPWGWITENDKWINHVADFLKTHPPEPMYKGYAAHVLTDIYNNITIWQSFCENHPKEAAKGYDSDYYNDMRHIDSRLFLEFPHVGEIFALLKKAVAFDIDNLVTAEEVTAIQNNILYENYKDIEAPPPRDYAYVSFDETLEFIDRAAEFCENAVQKIKH